MDGERFQGWRGVKEKFHDSYRNRDKNLDCFSSTKDRTWPARPQLGNMSSEKLGKRMTGKKLVRTSRYPQKSFSGAPAELPPPCYFFGLSTMTYTCVTGCRVSFGESTIFNTKLLSTNSGLSEPTVSSFILRRRRGCSTPKNAVETRLTVLPPSSLLGQTNAVLFQQLLPLPGLLRPCAGIVQAAPCSCYDFLGIA